MSPVREMPDERPRRIQDPEELPDDDLDRSLRPRRLEDFVGQEAIKDQLAVSIAAAASRGEALDHVLLAGPPGLGKTSLAQIVAAELEVPFVQTAGPALERKGDVAAFLTALEPRAVFFVDEIHRLPRALEETFYPAMEDSTLPITVGQGAGARVVTLAAAAVHADRRDHAGRAADHAAARPVRDPAPPRALRPRGPGHGSCGARRGCSRSRSRTTARARSRSAAAARRGSPTACSSACATTPRSAARRRDRGGRGRRSTCSRSTTRASTASTGRSCGRSARSSAAGRWACRRSPSSVGEEQDTIEDVYEPYLLQRGLIERTPRGRAATRRAFAHLGLEPPGPLALLVNAP